MKVSRRLNYTGRKKIPRECFQITLKGDDSKPRFEATINLIDLKLPDEAVVFIEAYRGNTTQRFPFGTVGNLRPLSNLVIEEVDLSGPTLFNIKVIDISTKLGLLLASAERIKPRDENEDENNSSPLLTLRTTDTLGQQVWRLEYSDDYKPVLSINSGIPGLKEQILKDPRFCGAVLPAVMREVLMLICWNDEVEEPEKGTWKALWIDFAENLADGNFPIKEEPSQVLRWIDEAVSGFCQKHRFQDQFKNFSGAGYEIAPA